MNGHRFYFRYAIQKFPDVFLLELYLNRKDIKSFILFNKDFLLFHPLHFTEQSMAFNIILISLYCCIITTSLSVYLFVLSHLPSFI